MELRELTAGSVYLLYDLDEPPSTKQLMDINYSAVGNSNYNWL
jgi:hypothetical protein